MKRSVRFFLRRFKRNPHFNVTSYTKGGALKSERLFSRSEAALRDKLAAAGLDVMSVSKASGAPRKARKAKKSAVTTKSRKRHMARKTRKAGKRRARTLPLSAYGRVYRKKIGKHMHSVRIIGSRKARAGKKKVRRAAVKWSGRKGTISVKGLAFGSAKKRGTHKVYFTNPKRRTRRARRNPVMAIGGEYVGGLTSAPAKLMGLFKGPNAVKNAAFTAGGAVGTFMLGGVLSAKVIKPLLEKVAPGFAAKVADPSTIQARIVGGILPYTAAFAITKLFGKKLGSDLSTAILLGGAVASGVELIRPGLVGDLLKKVGLGEIPTVGPALAGLGALSGPVAGLGYGEALAGYVEAPSYAGTAGYVEAPSYAGTAGVAGYVEAPSYAGTAGADELAGTFLEDASADILANNWLS